MSNYDLKEVSIEKLDVRGNVNELVVNGKRMIAYAIDGREARFCFLASGDREEAIRLLELILKKEFRMRENKITDIFGNEL